MASVIKTDIRSLCIYAFMQYIRTSEYNKYLIVKAFAQTSYILSTIYLFPHINKYGHDIALISVSIFYNEHLRKYA